MIDKDFIASVEKNYFRTNQDIGAEYNALFIWNIVRKEAGLEPLKMDDLPAYCMTHKMYHKIQPDYECIRKVDTTTKI